MFDDLPELYVIKQFNYEYNLIQFHHGILYLSIPIMENTTEDEKLVLWIILKNRYNLNILRSLDNYRLALKEWENYGKNKHDFIKILSKLIHEYSKNNNLKTKHLNYINELYNY